MSKQRIPAENIRVLTPQNTMAEEAVGHIPEYRGVFFTGKSTNIDTGVFRTLWPEASAYVHPTAAQASTIVSDSADDAAAGTGARTMALVVLDSDFESFTIVIELNGLTPVALPFDIIALNACAVVTTGTGNVNAGAIKVQGTITEFGLIPAGNGNLLQAVKTVPKGETWVAMGFFSNCHEGDEVNVRAVAYAPSGAMQVVSENFVSSSPYDFKNFVGIPFPETFSLEVDATSTGGPNQSVVVILQFRAYKNDYV